MFLTVAHANLMYFCELYYIYFISINQSINQYIYNAPWYRGACYSADYAETKRNVLSRVLNVLTDGAVRQFRGREFQSLGAATEKRRAAVSKLCGETDRSFCVDDRSERDWLYGLIRSARLLKRGHQITKFGEFEIDPLPDWQPVQAQ